MNKRVGQYVLTLKNGETGEILQSWVINRAPNIHLELPTESEMVDLICSDEESAWAKDFYRIQSRRQK